MPRSKKEQENQKEEKSITKEKEKQTTKKEKAERQQKKIETSTEKKQEQPKDLMVKENSLNEMQLQKIETEIKKQTTISEQKQKKINAKVFQNIFIAIILVLYFIFINLGSLNLKAETFLKDLQVFSIITMGITIIVFEKAYKKDSGELALHGIEALALSITTLMTIYIGMVYPSKFRAIINVISMLFAIYYVAKSIVIDYKMMSKALKQTSDIHKIAKN